MMMKKVNKFFSIKTRIILLAFFGLFGGVVTVYITLSLSASTLFTEQKRTIDTMVKTALTNTSINALNIGSKDMLKAQIDELINTGIIESVQIYDNRGDLFLSNKLENHSSNSIKQFSLVYKPLVIDEFDTTSNESIIIGVVHYSVNDNKLLEVTKSSIFGHIKILVIIFLLFIPLVFLLLRSTTGRLKQVRFDIINFGKGLYKEKPEEELGEDEISDIHQALNLAARNIYDTNLKLIERSKELEIQVTLANEAKQETLIANQRKDDFVKNVTHELKHPVSGVVSGIDLVNTIISKILDKLQNVKALGPLNSQVNTSVNDIVSDIMTALRCIDIVSVSAIKADHLIGEILFAIHNIYTGVELLPEKVSLVSKIDSLNSEFKRKCYERNLDFSSEVFTPELLPNVFVDFTKWYEVVSILLKNAIQFTEKGSVSFELRAENLPDSIKVTFICSDTGIGIDPEYQKQIFSLFQIGENPTSKSISGIGTGLAVAKKIASALDGHLALIKSESNKGSTFLFECKMNKADILEPDESPLLPPPDKVKHILYVDDSPSMRVLFSHWCKEHNVALTLAENGKEGFELYKENPGNYDLLAVDCYMPVMNGYEMVKAIREFEVHQNLPNTYIVAVTADGSDKNKKECQDAGYNDFIPKPFTTATFENLFHPNY